MPVGRYRRYSAEWWLVMGFVILVGLSVVVLIDMGLALALQWILVSFGVEAPYWPCFALVVLVGLVTGGGALRR